MVKFSLGREDDGEGPSNNGSSKRPRTSFLWGSPTPSYIEVPEAEEEGGEEGEEGEETREQQEQHRESSDPGDRFLLPNFGSDYHEEEGEEFEEEEYGEVDSADQPLPSRQLVQNFGLRRDIRDGPIAITLMDPEVLDCGICCEPLTAPIFQCENGHIACSPCCDQMMNTCAFCSLPIGYNRCRALENVLASIRLPCKNKEYGCEKAVPYGKSHLHEKDCMFSPCSCPYFNSHPDCIFIGSLNQLEEHFQKKHKFAVASFSFGKQFLVNIRQEWPLLILEEDSGGLLFTIENTTERIGNMITVSCILPIIPAAEEFVYDLKAEGAGSTLNFHSSASIIHKWDGNEAGEKFILIPSAFFGVTGEVDLHLCIRRKNIHHGNPFINIP
ncbi:E3 ubiquitin-protein ligase SINA-like 10 [Carica papaya]|uniref:E3 ubiquitin-protein ligase SINA-like 10 n=1 Tax=Carica papaya TaxID=3649 RepID=UPI000B8D158B|nr:E3 ubiquitin-protein ligase SINA-like 10 [Carica papaya]